MSSFDVEFDYSTVVVGMTGQITRLQEQINIYTTKIALLQASSYAVLVADEISDMESLVTIDTLKAANYQSIIDEIARVQAMTQEEKALIYYFYSILGVKKENYMEKLLFNTSKISDPNVLTLYNDVVTPPETKLMVAKLLYNKFSMNTQYNEIFDVKAYL